MSCSGVGLITLDQALELYSAVQTLAVVTLPLVQAHRHVLAAAVT